MKSIRKVLIANRSEVAKRIIATCKYRNIKTVAIFSSEDKFSPYVYLADESYSLKGLGAIGYLNQNEIIKIALEAQVDAIHPGYGFLSENALFAKKVVDAGLCWIGPRPEIVGVMGDKIRAKQKIRQANVSTIPGYNLYIGSDKKLILDTAKKIGYPIIIKDPLGGGGKGIRKVENSVSLFSAFDTVASEVKTMTGADFIVIEKYIENGRHIEVQIAGDGKKFIHLYERECSIQRRNQKIIEEAPCNFIPKKTLEKIYLAAISVAKSVNYNSIGTVEFMVMPDQRFYFLEMNTRLQVEHSVTEETLGIDLVALQIELAENKKLRLDQNDIFQRGHAVECRISSEDTFNNFMPSDGKISKIKFPNFFFSRVDQSIEQGDEICSYFDPMIAKITTFGENRNTAINKMILALKNTILEGTKNNINFLISILNSEHFLSGDISTQLVEKNLIKNFSTTAKEENSQLEVALLIAAVLENCEKRENKKVVSGKSWGKQKWQ